MNKQCVVILGAGIAGLSAGIRLAEAGVEVQLLEARERIGGRIWTEYPPSVGAPIELGAEFVHGKVDEIWRYQQPGEIDLYEGKGSRWCEQDRSLTNCDFFAQVDEVLKQLEKYSGPDVSFLQFLDSLKGIPPRVRERALNYVMGFHAGDPREIGVQAIQLDSKAEEQTEGNRTFRIRQGYGALLQHMELECKRLGVRILLEHVVSKVEWGADGVLIGARNSAGLVEFVADCALVTLPLGILQLQPGEPGSVEFDPPLREKERALAKLVLGDVRRVQFVFSEVFWSDTSFVGRNDLADLQFLFSDDEFFPTWWSYAPLRVPVLTAWSPALKSDRLKGMSTDEAAEIALKSLSRILHVDVAELRRKVVSSYSHDWITDPFTRGAYSYAKAGGVDGFRELAQPLAGKLYFAGEATEATGHHATVHGAIASGERTAEEVLARVTGASLHNG